MEVGSVPIPVAADSGPAALVRLFPRFPDVPHPLRSNSRIALPGAPASPPCCQTEHRATHQRQTGRLRNRRQASACEAGGGVVAGTTRFGKADAIRASTSGRTDASAGVPDQRGSRNVQVYEGKRCTVVSPNDVISSSLSATKIIECVHRKGKRARHGQAQ